MNTILTIFLILFVTAIGFARQFGHVPPCGGTAHSTSICYGYATGRAFGKTLWNNDPGGCNLSTLHFNAVPSTYFNLTRSVTLQAKTILAFEPTGETSFGHVAYVDDNLLLNEVHNEGAKELTGLTLEDVVYGNAAKGHPNGHGLAVAKFVRKTLWNGTIKNQFSDNSEGGTLRLVIPDEGESHPASPYSLQNRYWGETITVDAEMDGQEVNGLVQLFQNWTRSDQQFSSSTKQAQLPINWAYNQAPTTSAVFRGKLVVSGTKVIPAGQTVIINQFTEIEIQSNSELVVYGRLVASGAASEHKVFASPGGTTWKGIRFEGSGANNSSLRYVDIHYAKQPIVATNTSNLTIDNVTIGNSTFYDNNFNDAAAIRLYGSTASISNTTISGVGWGYSTGSWNGIRFAQGSGGSVTNCLIQNLGYGNGIVIQGGSSPTILNTTIRNVYYHGFSIDGNGSGLPSLEGNIIDGARQYTAVRLRNSQAVLARNQLTNKGYAMYAEYYSSPRTPDNIPGGNSFSQNDHGLVAYYYSNPHIGLTRTNTNDPCFTYLFGACNYFSGNLYSDANAATGCYVTVQANYWPSYPPDPARFPVSDGSYIDYSLPRDPAVDADCWNYICGGGGGGPLMIDPNITSIARVIPDSFDVKKLLRQASRARLGKDFTTAATIYRKLLLRAKQETDRAIALVGFLDLFRASEDQSFVGEIERYRTAPGKLGVVASELLMSAYASTGRYGEAKALAYTHKSKHAGTEHGKNALLELVSLAGYTESERATAQAAYRELIQKFPDTDKGLLVAINPGVSEVEGSAQTAQSIEEAPPLANFPNPFNPSTTIQFKVTNPGRVSLKVYDVLGREVATLVNEHKQAGLHAVQWDAGSLPSGMYFYRLEANGKSYVQKMLLVR